MPDLSTAVKLDDKIELEIDLEKEIEEYNELLSKCTVTMNKIKKRRENGRKSSVNKQE